MSDYVECPSEYRGRGPSLFLAGGISGCPDWQADLRALLADTRLTLLNPRRARFPIADPAAAEEQIGWEHRHLRRADAILFWFVAAQIQPIALYELGAWSMTDKPLFVGVDPAYPRRADVLIQTRLQRPEILVAGSLAALAAQVRAHYE